MKLNRQRWTIVARPEKVSVPKKIVAPKMRSKAPTSRRYSFSTGVHPKALQHFSRGPESDRLALLLDSQGRQE
jgi:hypothetical protein